MPLAKNLYIVCRLPLLLLFCNYELFGCGGAAGGQMDLPVWHVFSQDISTGLLIFCWNYFLILAPSRLSLASCFMSYDPLVMCCLVLSLTLRPQGMCTQLLRLLNVTGSVIAAWMLVMLNWVTGSAVV